MNLLITISLCKLMVLGSASHRILNYGISNQDKKGIVNKHNELRSLLQNGLIKGQPQAANMKIMKYDERLSKAAQNLSNSCTFEHVNVNDERWWFVGQNLYMYITSSSIQKQPWDKVIQNWFDEHHDYHYPDGPDDNTGHYTQIVWAKTEYVGCGYTMYMKARKSLFHHLYVCNYGPGGNYNNLPPYRKAK